jgi:hypothetical protein
MLASITPLGERGRHARYWLTIVFFVTGSTAAGAAVGAAAGLLGRLVLGAHPGGPARALTLAGALVLGLALDAHARGGRLPGPRRQVNENWLTAYRGWVYGLGFGAQLGAGVTTIVNASAVYVALVAAVLAATPAGGALIVGCFGAARGLSLLAGAGVRAPADLRALHRRLTGAAPGVRRGTLALQAVLALALVGVVTL